MCVVSIYQYWEDHYRKKLAIAMDLKLEACNFPDVKDCIFSEIFGDLASLRNCIIHKAGKADKKIPQAPDETWFKKNDAIFIDRKKFEKLIDGISKFINEFKINPQNFIRSG